MKLTFVFVIMSHILSSAQSEVNLSWEELGEIKKTRETQYGDLVKSLIYNHVNTELGIADRISVIQLEGGYLFVNEGNSYTSLNQIAKVKGERFDLKFDDFYDEYHYVHSTYIDSSKIFRIKVEIDMPAGEKGVVTVENIVDNHFNDYYLKKTLQDEIISEGYYYQIDSIYLDTLSTFDPNTYTETVVITNHTVKSIKCGNWKMNLSCDYQNLAKSDTSHMVFFFPPCPLEK